MQASSRKERYRLIERITGHDRDRIRQLLEDLALHAEMVNSILFQELKLRQFEVDEMWTFVKKSKRKLSQEAEIQMLNVMSGYSIS